MTFMGIGDLALGYRLRHQDFQLKQQLHRLSAEVTTGRVTDVAAAAAGDLSSLAGIERSLTRLGGYRIATTEAAELLAGVQSALATAQETAAGLAPGLLGATLTPTDRQVATLANDAAQRLAGVVSGRATGICFRVSQRIRRRSGRPKPFSMRSGRSLLRRRRRRVSRRRLSPGSTPLRAAAALRTPLTEGQPGPSRISARRTARRFR